MEIRRMDIQKIGNKIVACIQHKDGSKVTISEEGEDCFLNWFWNVVQVEGAKGSFEKSGEWR